MFKDFAWVQRPLPSLCTATVDPVDIIMLSKTIIALHLFYFDVFSCIIMVIIIVISLGTVLSLGYVSWNPRHVKAFFFLIFSMFPCIFNQHIDVHANSLVNLVCKCPAWSDALFCLIFVGWPSPMMYTFMCMSFCVASCMSYTHMQVGMSVVVLIVCMLGSMPAISLSLFSVWFCLNSQSAVYRSWPCLYSMNILYW